MNPISKEVSTYMYFAEGSQHWGAVWLLLGTIKTRIIRDNLRWGLVRVVVLEEVLENE